MSSKTEKPTNTVSGKTEKPTIIVSGKSEKPTNLRADVMPKDGYVLSVDGKLKTRYETSEDAMTAAVKLKQSYPVIQITVFDAATRSHSPVIVPEQ